MTIEVEAKATEKRNVVVVGIRIDSQSRELLNWALVKVAESGDKVVALYVSHSPEQASKEKPYLDDYLGVYEGLCSARKVDLIGQVSTGNSIRKALVREAKNHAAGAVVVGIVNHSALRGWASVAKFCARKLPPITDVIAIQNGKVVFRRYTNDHLPGQLGDPRPSLLLHFQNAKERQEYETEDRKSSSEEIHGSGHGSKDRSGKLGGQILGASDIVSSRPLLDMILDIPHEKPGWPLLLRANSETAYASRVRNISVVEWVLRLPSHSAYGTSKSSSIKENSLEVEMGGIDNLQSCSSKEGESTKCLEPFQQRNPFACKQFGHKFLKDSTSQFSSENLIGKGGCNRVYKGILQDGKQVAVKILRSTSEVRKEFFHEIEIISSLAHKNILPLFGICIEDNKLVSVYDFLPRGSLEKILHGNPKEKTYLSWERRFKVALGIAEALNYLHSECAQPVIHRDVKSSNILLSDSFEPQLSDFGLAIWGPTTSSYITKAEVLGTFGYLAPEYFMYGKVSEKIDVYAFGVVLLELLSGRKPISSETEKGQESLVMWAKPITESEDFKGLLDPNLEGKFDEAQMKRMVLAASLCITRSASRRPKMSQVLEILKGDKDIQGSQNFQNNSQVNLETQDHDDEVYPNSSAELHLNLALLGVDEDSTSPSSVSDGLAVEEYMRRR